MTMFDPNAFLDATLTEPTEKRPPLPPGDYIAQIGEVKARTWQGRTDPTKSGIAWDIPLEVQVPPDVKETLKLSQDTLRLTDSCLLDLTESGTIDNSPGKNRRLRMYREALDMNKPGDTFSARRMTGGLLRVKISHELYEGQPVERIDGVIKAS